MPTTSRKIKIKCDGSDSLALDEIRPFQGDLKRRTELDIAAVARSIEQFGFSFPFFIWKSGKINWCLDGHGRLAALRQMAEDGWSVPALPVVYVQAASKAEAKQKLLRMNSQYGAMSVEGVLEFAEGIEVDWAELSLPSGALRLEIPDDMDYDPLPEVDMETDFEGTGRIIIVYEDDKEREALAQAFGIDMGKVVYRWSELQI